MQIVSLFCYHGERNIIRPLVDYSVEDQLSELGWDESEYRDLSHSCRFVWISLVEQPKPLTKSGEYFVSLTYSILMWDTAWKALHPKLEQVLWESTIERGDEETWERQLVCSGRVTTVLFNIGATYPGVFGPIATALQARTAPASVLVARCWNRLVLTAFPNMNDTLEWPFMKLFAYGEYNQQETNGLLQARLNQIGSEATKWIEQVVSDLSSLLQKGQRKKKTEDRVLLTVSNYLVC